MPRYKQLVISFLCSQAPAEFSPTSSSALLGITNAITTFILYGYLIPISLYVTMEIVKVVQSMVFIARDIDMYHAETDTPAQVRGADSHCFVLSWWLVQCSSVVIARDADAVSLGHHGTSRARCGRRARHDVCISAPSFCGTMQCLIMVRCMVSVARKAC